MELSSRKILYLQKMNNEVETKPDEPIVIYQLNFIPYYHCCIHSKNIKFLQLHNRTAEFLHLQKYFYLTLMLD